MRAAIVDEFGLERLEVKTVDDPGPLGPTDVRVRLHAAALNYRDVLVVEGKYDPRFPLPLIPCSDGAGEVAEVGSEVEQWQPGDRVLPVFAPLWFSGPPHKSTMRKTLGGPLDGTAAEWLVIDEGGLVRAPEHLSFEQAATLPCAAVTAYRALIELERLGDQDDALRDRWILCQGTGGVSLFALQMAKALGARVAVISRSESKLERIADLGADFTLCTRNQPEWSNAVRDATGGVHQVIEIGGGDTLAESVRATLPGGTISMVGVLGGTSRPLALLPVIMNQLRLQGVYVGSKATLEATVRLFERFRLVPVISKTFPLEATREAFEALARSEHVGKITVRCMA